MKLFCSEVQAQALLNARKLPARERKAVKRTIFASIHMEHKLAKQPKIVVFVENPDNPMYRQLRDKRTKLPLDDGRPEPVVVPVVKAVKPKKASTKKVAAKSVAKAPAKKAPAKAVVKPAAKKVPAKKAPAKAVVKPAAKKAPAKAVVKATAKPAAKATKKSAK